MDLITNIQKYSIHDGDGIRTTVFFKGCPLKCVWCHNPETQRFEQEIQYDAEKCTGCGVCAKVRPNGAVTMEDGRPKLDKKLCKLCGKCENFCTQGTREIVGQEYPVKTLKKENYPSIYKIDIANPILKIGIEVDGNSHCALSRQAEDKKKVDLLNSLGWNILRFKNEEVLNNLSGCIDRVMSLI